MNQRSNPNPPSRSKPLRRILVWALILGVLIGAGVWVSRWFPASANEDILPVAAPTLDATEEAAWRKANPWLFTRAEYEPFRTTLVLPLARGNGLAPAGVRKRGAIVEWTFPSGRPIHEYAYELETLCTRAGITVVEGRETGRDRVEYLLQDAKGNGLKVRLVLGTSALPGSVRMALVIVGLGSASAEDIQAWLAYSEAVTLVFPDTAPVFREESIGESNHEIFVELPMEPSTFPYVKPGPRALFIDFSRGQVEEILRDRLDAYPKAGGFATTHGDRAIENPQLMESVFHFMASRSLSFLDLTGSRLSQTATFSQQTGVESFVSRAQLAGPEKDLDAEIERRTTFAKKSGEGIWVLRHAPGLPATLTRVFGRHQDAFAELGLEWVSLRDLRKDESN